MQSLRALSLCLILVSATAFAEDGDQGCAGQDGCVPPVYVAPDSPSCEGPDCPQHPAIVCEGFDCLPQDNRPAQCDGQDCGPAEGNALEECEGEDCELAPPPE